MIRRPPRSTRTDTPFPYTTLFRSAHPVAHSGKGANLSFLIRPARPEDLQPLYEMAKLAGDGFTNLPADRDALAAKLERNEKAMEREEDNLEDQLIVLTLENAETGQVRGTCQIFTHVGQTSPFYSYRLGVLTQSSRELGRTFRAQMLGQIGRAHV